MATITASEVNKLRKQTGAGMMDCKNALVEAGGDFEAAVDVLRKQGQKVAAKRADREATEGAVLAGTNADNTSGAVICLNSETDFVAKNEGFIKLVSTILEIAVSKKPVDLEALKALPYEEGLTVAEKLIEQTGVIGEKLDLSSYESLEAPYVYGYIHAGNKLASLVGLNEKNEEVAKNVAMQVAAMNPVALDKDGVSEDIIDRELEVGKELARQEGKPEEMLDKIARGRLNKFFKESTLLEQAFIKDSKISVAQYLGKEGKDMKVLGFKRVGLGV